MVLAEPDRVTMLSSGKQVKWMSLPPRVCTWQHRASGEQGRSQTEERAQAQQGKAWTQPGAAGPGGWWWRACLDPSSNLRCYVQALCSCRPAQEQRHFLGPTLRLPTTSLHWQLAQAALRPGSGSPALQEQGRGREVPPAGVLTLGAASSEQGPDEQAPHRLCVSLPARSRDQWASATPSAVRPGPRLLRGLQTGLNPALLRTGILGSIQADGGRLWI